jgi:hypothetical protein
MKPSQKTSRSERRAYVQPLMGFIQKPWGNTLIVTRVAAKGPNEADSIPGAAPQTRHPDSRASSWSRQSSPKPDGPAGPQGREGPSIRFSYKGKDKHACTIRNADLCGLYKDAPAIPQECLLGLLCRIPARVDMFILRNTSLVRFTWPLMPMGQFEVDLPWIGDPERGDPDVEDADEGARGKALALEGRRLETQNISRLKALDVSAQWARVRLFLRSIGRWIPPLRLLPCWPSWLWLGSRLDPTRRHHRSAPIPGAPVGRRATPPRACACAAGGAARLDGSAMARTATSGTFARLAPRTTRIPALAFRLR